MRLPLALLAAALPGAAGAQEASIRITNRGTRETRVPAWMDGVYLGQNVLPTGVPSPPRTGTATFTVPPSLRTAGEHVLTVMVRNNGHTQDMAADDAHKEGRGLISTSLGTAATWRIQGNLGGEDPVDPARGIKFSTYASRCIENEMRMQFRRQRRVPPMVSLQEPLEAGQDGGLTLMDAIPDDVPLQESLEQRDLARRLSARLSRLPARERQVLALRYGLGGAAPHTQLQVAQKLGLSRSYISRLESRGLSLLKKL